MTKIALLLVIGAIFCTSARSGANDAPLLPSTELMLPQFQAKKLEEDGSGAQFLFDREQSLWILGNTSLWIWQPEAKKLSRMRLNTEKSEVLTLKTMSTDGLNLFASSKSTAYQVTASEHRVFRYPALKQPSQTTPFFVGKGDDFWWFANNQLIKLDRYGKSLGERIHSISLAKAHGAAYLAHTKQIFWPERTTLMRLNIDSPQILDRILSTKSPILDVQVSGNHLFAHTMHTILRVSNNGKVLQSIPVEGRRRLLRMHIGAERHAYLFNDQLLEIYDLQKKQTLRYMLPIEDEQTVDRIAVSWPLIAVASEGQIRVFRLAESRETGSVSARFERNRVNM